MDLQICSRTDVGRVRSNNEDSFLADAASGLFIVCDGMGGHNAGEVASRIACDTVQAEMAESLARRDREAHNGQLPDVGALRLALDAAMGAACKEIHRQASRSSEQAGMGTTCTVLVLAGGGKAVFGHVGDSRLYVLRAGRVHQLSEDHTYVNELVRRGALAPEQARHHPQGNVLSRAMGVQPTVAIDTMVFDVDRGDTYLVCSDGVYNYFDDAAELGTLLAGADLEVALDQIIARALDRGGHDNCTGIVLRLAGRPAPGLGAEERLGLLKKLPIFAHLTYHELVRVMGLTEMMQAPAGTELITEGQPGTDFYVVLAGEVEVFKAGSSLSVLGPGAHLGEMAMVDNAPRSATVRARTAVDFLVMRRAAFYALIRGEAAIACKLLWSFVRALSHRLRASNEALLSLGGSEAPPDLEVFRDRDR